MIERSQKTSSAKLFDLLNDASEESLFCSDILQCREDVIFSKDFMLSTVKDLLAVISFMIEKNLVRTWSEFEIKAAEVKKKKSVEPKQRGLESKENTGTNTVQDSSEFKLKATEEEKSDQIEESAESKERSGKSQDDVAEPGTDTAHRSQDSIDGRQISHSRKRIPFEEYLKGHKLTKVFKLRAKSLFKKFRKHLKKFGRTFRRHMNILTKVGRQCARGYLLYIIQMHSMKKCWNGDWKLSDMVVSDGEFIISKEALLDLTQDRAVEDLKNFFELVMKPYYNSRLGCYPLYFDEFQADILRLPDPSTKWEKFLVIEKYLALHLAFMPPLSRSSLLFYCYKVTESLRHNPKIRVDIYGSPKHDWRKVVEDLSYASDVFYHGVDRVADPTFMPYGPSYYFLLKFCRHFGTHDSDHTKINNGQPLDDLALSDLVLGQVLSKYISDLVWLLVKKTKMGGSYYRAFQAYEASDGELVLFPESESDDAISEESSDEED